MSNYILIKSDNFKFKDGMKIAGFDFDFTLIKPKSGKKFPIDQDDWELWDESILDKLNLLSKSGYSLVIFSNQNGVGSGKVSSTMVTQRFKNFIDFTNLNWVCIAATQKDLLRKPNVCMWNKLFDNYKINTSQSFYVGDAAGRIKDYVKGRPKDFSCSDRKFAYNLKIVFYTPEEFFLNEELTKNYVINGFNPLEYNLTKPYRNFSFKKKEKEMIIMVGCPASGKSRFVRKYYQEYDCINQDTLKTKSKCLKACLNSIKENKSIIIDNTNPTVSARSDYIELAKNNNYQVKCYIMNIDKELGKHMNYFRFKKGKGVKHKLIPDVVYNVYYKKFEEPQMEEGFLEIKKIDPNFKFKKNKELELFLQFN
jgi:bifunctional polynucleotide phosphatase/kinase